MITLLSMGTRGDTQPYIALGAALQRLGQPVRLAGFEAYRDLVEGCGLDFFPVRGDIAGAAASQVGAEAMQADSPLKLARSFRSMSALIYDLQADFYQACQGAQAVVYHPGAAIGYFIAQELGVPAILAPPFPMTPTRRYPALIFYDRPHFGAAYNRLTHRLFERVMWMASSKAVRQFWTQQFGRSPQDFACPFPRQVTARCPTVISCSPRVFPRPTDWPEHVHMPGYWFLDDEAGWQPPAALLDYLDSGPAPVYVGFGSIGAASQAQETTRLVVEALQRTRAARRARLGLERTEQAGRPSRNNLHPGICPAHLALPTHGGCGAPRRGGHQRRRAARRRACGDHPAR